MVELFGLGAFVVVTIIVALLFDFVNGFHDSANAIATVVATRVLTPLQAVGMAAFFNFIGVFIFSTAVAATIGKGIIDPAIVTTELVFGALVGAIVWDLVTWWLGLPTSSSHALVGGLVGAAVAAVGDWSRVLLPESREFLLAGEYAAFGALGGLLLGLALYPLSRLKAPRFTIYALGALVAFLSLRYYWNHFDPSFLDWKESLHTGLQMTIWLVMGFAGGALLGVMLHRPANLGSSLGLAFAGLFVGVAYAVITGKLVLGGLTKVVMFMVVSPFLGFFGAFFLGAVVMNVARFMHPGDINSGSRRLQLVSSAFYALSHGTNDAQKTMGVIAVLLFSAGALGGTFYVPTWVAFSAHAAMGLGTFFGGWRIVKTMAARITHLRPVQGMTAETAGGVVLTAMAESGIPVSTTHAITSSIMGVGATRRLSAVKWGVSRRIFLAWIVTIPASAIVAWLSYHAVVWVLAYT